MENQSSGNPIFTNTSSLRIRFIVPIAATMILVLLVLALSLFYYQSQSQSLNVAGERLTRVQDHIQNFLEQNLKNDTAALKSITTTFMRDEKVKKLFMEGNKSGLLEETEDLYEFLNSEYSITHFYFINPDRVNLLRVHSPNRSGDTINRTTLLRAEKYGVTSYGVELGVLGTFTLRVVTPWNDPDSGKLIGYIELGLEIDHIIKKISDTFDLDVVVVIFKQYLDKDRFLDGMQTLGRSVHWDRYDDVVLATENRNIPEGIDEHLIDLDHNHRNEILNITGNEKSYWLLTAPIKDVTDESIAKMVMVSDVTFEINAAQRALFAVGIVVFLSFFVLIIIFYMIAKKIEQQLKLDEKQLHDLAARDDLTRLYTRRVFDIVMKREMERAKNFDQQFSLLMIDLDFFKKVNDEYGHQAGDRILQEVSRRLVQEAGPVNLVCRYGGEEMAIIMPHSDGDSALDLAHRVHAIVSALPVYIEEDKSVSVTVSIGVATYPDHAASDILLISAADKALYTAKESGRNRVCQSTSQDSFIAA